MTTRAPIFLTGAAAVAVTVYLSRRRSTSIKSNDEEKAMPLPKLEDVVSKGPIDDHFCNYWHFSGNVYTASEKDDWKGGFALKVLELAQIKPERIAREIVAMQKLDHPNVIKLHSAYADESFAYLVMRYGSGGNVYGRVCESFWGLKESDALQVMHQLLKAIEYCHDNGVCHGCPTPKKLVFKSRAPIAQSEMMLVDFGMCKFFTPGEHHVFHEEAGTSYCVAPEALAGTYDEKCDLWSCGIILYVMLCGRPPFYAKSDAEVPEVLAKIRLGNFEFDPVFNKVSAECHDFIWGLLKMNPQDRFTAKGALVELAKMRQS